MSNSSFAPPLSTGSGPLSSWGAASSRPASSSGEADFQYWHDVFEQAQGPGVQTQACQPGPNEPLPSEGTLRAARQQGDASIAASAVGSQDDAIRGGSGAKLTGRPSQLGDSHQPSARPMLIIGGQAFRHPLGASSELSAQSDVSDAPLVEQLADGGLASPSEREQIDAALHAHVMQTATGDWKVALRSPRSLSVAQALAAVAQALQQEGMPTGQVEQVMLNGACIYQQASQAGASASSTFEIQC